MSFALPKFSFIFVLGFLFLSISTRCMDSLFRNAWFEDWKTAVENYKNNPLCPVNSYDNAGWNVLHYAAFYGTTQQALALIIELRADIYALTITPGGTMAQLINRTPIMLALEGGNEGLIDNLLEQHIITSDDLERQRTKLQHIQEQEALQLSAQERERQQKEIQYMRTTRNNQRTMRAKRQSELARNDRLDRVAEEIRTTNPHTDGTPITQHNNRGFINVNLRNSVCLASTSAIILLLAFLITLDGNLHHYGSSLSQ